MERDKVVERLYQEHPLTRVSVYSEIQVQIVRNLGEEILACLDASVSNGTVDASGLNRAYGRFWLWCLGAYEIVRTMSQAKVCFSGALAVKIAAFKKRVSPLRIAFAKQELQGKRKPIEAGASIQGVDAPRKDMTYEVRGTILSARDLIAEFDALVGGITEADVLHDHRSSYK